ncbi:c-type cytochrome [Breoghania sp.]|uniref:c-type cytochrome n=1 Tax=Breoghania sp. TaxID=2065378 RepID=UPI00262F30BE|nr:c-type cytochrome [Breoghania sp.]MDJ0930496.1 c-type cytochrome [Breoghania sp.]
MVRRKGLPGSVFVVVALAVTTLAAAPDAAPDSERGQIIFQTCEGCHQVGEGARHGIGPHLDAFFGRCAGSLDAFKYSGAMHRYGEDGLVWNAETLDAYLARPQAMVPGTRMSYRGLTDAAKRADLIAYIASATAVDPTLAPAPRAEIGAAAMGIDGDPDYGEYLAGESVTCHQRSGRTDGIPSIVGWLRGAFIRALFEYKTNVRQHQVMKLMAVNLGNEEIAALAAYFRGFDPQ